MDAYCGKEINAPKEALFESYEAYAAARMELSSLTSKSEEKQRQHDFLKYELAEITAANLTIGEDEELEAKLLFVQNSEKILSGITSAYELITGESSENGNPLSHAKSLLEELSSLDASLREFSDLLSDCYYRLEELSRDIRHYSDKVSFSEEEMNEIILRLEVINTLKRKHGGSIESVLSYAEKITKDIAGFENSDERISALRASLPELERNLVATSKKVSEIRRQAASDMEEKIAHELADLNFNNSDFKVVFHPTKSPEGKLHFTPSGIDQIEFMISTNKGEPVKPLSKIASGGEISRIMLAFKRIVGDYDDKPTMIFDEIDSGISGATASIVGRKLSQIGQSRQVLCITHLPQVAAFGKENYKIIKDTKENQTFTSVKHLSEDEKTEEIARMLGGVDITESALANARDLIKNS